MFSSFESELTSNPRVPPEIVDIIINHACEDTAALLSMAVVHSSWLPLVRFCLFQRIVVNNKNAERMRALVESPTTASDIQATKSMEINVDDSDASNYVEEMLAELANNRSYFVSLRSLQVTFCKSYTLAVAFPFAQLTRLHIHEALGVSFKEWTQRFNDMKSLEDLGCSTAIVAGDRPDVVLADATNPTRPLPRLSQLSLGETSTETALEWLVSLRDKTPRISTLSVGRVFDRECDLLGQYLQILGESIRCLALNFAMPAANHSPVNALLRALNHCTDLRALYVGGLWNDTLPSVLKRSFSDLTCTGLRNFAVVSWNWRPAYFQYHKAAFVEIDDMLFSSRFDKLRRVDLFFSQDLDSTASRAMEVAALDCFPKSSARGIIRVHDRRSDVFKRWEEAKVFL